MIDGAPETYTTPDDAAAHWLPAWFVPRMMQGSGGFALWLSTGVLLPVERIERIHRAADGSVWLDVLLTLADDPAKQGPLAAATNPEASINAAYVVAVIETGRYDPESAWDGAWLEVNGRIARGRS